MSLRIIRPHWVGCQTVLWLAVAALAICVGGCGGGGGTGGGGGGGGNQSQDFTLLLSPSSVTVIGGGSATFTASVTGLNGFASTVALSIGGLPTGVTISPSNLQVTPGASLQITLAAASSVSGSAKNLTVTGVSGSLSHSASLSLTVKAAVVNPSLSRTRYVRTDMATEYPFVVNASWIVFDSHTKRFFVSDPGGNQIVVMDATKQAKIGSIPIPGAFGIDESPDGTALYAGTQVGDVYAIDPVAMTVKHRYLASRIGPYGFAAYVVRVLVNGKLVLLGGQGGIQNVDGYGGFAIWNPSDNSIEMYGTSDAGQILTPHPNCIRNIGAFTLSGDRSLIVEGSIDSDGTLCTMDPVTGQENVVTSRAFLYTVAVTPDGKSLLVPDYTTGGTILVYDAKTLTQTSSFPVAGDTSSAASMIVSADSTILYMAGGGIAYAYNIASGKLVGWTPNVTVVPTSGGGAVGSIYGPQMQAIDGTGLIAGPMEEGVGFIDTSALQTGPVGTALLNAYLTPATGPVSGGTQVQWSSGTGAVSAFFGANPATALSVSSTGLLSATSPAGSPGPVDIFTLMPDGGEQIVPEGFSYGPTIIEATPNASTSEGGGTGILYGYGFGSTADNAPIPTGLTITVGGTPVTITRYTGNAYGLLSPPFNLEAVAYTIPPGVSGSSADIETTSQSGSTTLAGGIHYLPAAQKYPLAAAALAQGIYDAKRNLYYFTDAAKIQIFSRTQGQWLTSIAVPAAPTGTTHRLWGIALSSDGSKLAVSDTGTAMIYLIDPDTPASVQSFAMPASCFAGSCSSSSNGVVTYPAGIAVSNAGMIYITAYPYGGSGYDGFLKLNTSTGKFTDYGIDAFGNAMYRNAISSDNARVFFNNDGEPFSVDTATDTVFHAQIAPGCCYGDYDLNLANNQTSLEATSYLYDTDLNAASYLTLNDREVLNTTYVYGVKLSPDGNLIFQPSVAGIDVFDGRIGTLRTRIALPYGLSQNYDALVSDGADNVVIAITDHTGDGVAVLDLTSLTEPAPLPYLNQAAPRPTGWHERASQNSTTASSQTKSRSVARPGVPISNIPHAMSSIVPQIQRK